MVFHFNAKKYQMFASVLSGAAGGRLVRITASGKIIVDNDDPRLGRVLSAPIARVQKALDALAATVSKL
jgi:hypothetical protein